MAICAFAQRPGDAELNHAYSALAKKDYDTAIAAFRAGLAKQPGNAGAHKDLAYTLLKSGDNAEARDEFERALQVNPKDETAALEYAFLAFETKKPIEARRMFDKLRHSGSPATRATAEQAFQNIDGPLASGIARWKEALARSANPKDPSTFSAHWELAHLAELRDELPLAADQYEICRQLKPQLSELLVILGRVWRELNRMDESRAAFLAASRSSDSRTAELALEQMDRRYPYPYEFVDALKLDPQNVALRKELAYLYLAMKKEPEAIEQFERVLRIDPHDEAARRQLNALRGIKTKEPARAAAARPAAADAKAMGLKSLALGYANDAIKYLELAHEQHPDDAEVTLKLGWAYNQAKDDSTAIRYFDQARNADDRQIAAEASKAFHNLNGDVMPQTTIWALPMFSSRWKDLFAYGQVKRTVPLPFLHGANKFVSFYLSTRFIGDLKSGLPTHVVDPQYLSESSFIFGAGASTKTWHHLTGWAEAGEAVKYLPGRNDVGTAIPDYRGGVNFAKGFGKLLGGGTGMFYETTGDAIYVSRFDKDWLFYSQHRAGRTFQISENTSFQALFNVNYVRDVKNQYWANTVEMGPGIKMHLAWMPPGVYFATDFLRGVYTNNSFNPRRPNYNDVRVSFWYARTK
jgi:tetratricopeptide (TPR) repeat protein